MGRGWGGKAEGAAAEVFQGMWVSPFTQELRNGGSLYWFCWENPGKDKTWVAPSLRNSQADIDSRDHLVSQQAHGATCENGCQDGLATVPALQKL